MNNKIQGDFRLCISVPLKVTWNKGYDVIIVAHDVTNKILSRYSNYIIEVVIWPKFFNYCIFMTEVTIFSILQRLHQKSQFFWGVLLVQVYWFETDTRYDLDKKVETISQKIFGSNSYVCRSYRGKNGRVAFLPGAEFTQNFYKGEIYLIVKNFVGKKFSLGKIFVT